MAGATGPACGGQARLGGLRTSCAEELPRFPEHVCRPYRALRDVFFVENLGLTGLLKNPFFAGLFMPGRGA